VKICPHFGACGGCSLQDLTPDAYRAKKRDAVVAALKRAGVEAMVEEPVIVPPRSRRRAVFKIKSLPKGLHVGFHAAKSHIIATC
jgi:23S rRNA (uracil1939-C5)-methyltransferase